MTATLSLGELLCNLEAELGRMAYQCHSLEEAAGVAARQSSGDPIQQEQLLATFQQLDILSQSLHDLARLAGMAGHSTLSRLSINPNMIRENLRLMSLADRVLGHPAPGIDLQEIELFI